MNTNANSSAISSASRTDLDRIAARIAALSPEQRRSAYAKLHAQGLDWLQLPIVPRAPSSGDAAVFTAPLSAAQQRQWFLRALDPASSAYHIAGALRLTGALDPARLEAALRALVSRHGALRTRFGEAGGEGGGDSASPRATLLTPTQALACFALVRGRVDDESLEPTLERFAAAPFELEQGLPMRAVLLELGPGRHALAMAVHHITADGWSLQLLLDELAVLYADADAALPPLVIDAFDHGHWLDQWLAAGEAERQLAYWREALGEARPVLAIATDVPRAPGLDRRRAHVELVLDRTLVTALRERCRAAGASLFAGLHAAFHALLYRHTGQSDIRVGVPVANRQRPELAGLVGLLVNVQVLRTQLCGNQRFDLLLAAVRDAVQGAQAHAELPLELLLEALGGERTATGDGLFQVLHNHQSQRRLPRLHGLLVEAIDIGGQTAQFDLVLDTTEEADGSVRARMSYPAGLFRPRTMAAMVAHYGRLTRALAEQPDATIAGAAMLGEDELSTLARWGGPGGSPEQQGLRAPFVHQQFEAHALRTPNATALLFKDQRLSYAELNARANRLAHRLLAELDSAGAGPGAEPRVGIVLERSVDMIVALIASLKAGCAYVPLDPAYPSERIAFMQEDSGISLRLTQSWLLPRLPSAEGVRTLALDDLDLRGGSEANPELALHHERLAYLIYTSGSTGRPKGVAVAHGPLAMHVRSIGLDYGMRPGDVELQFASINFDGAHERIWVPLGFGAALLPRDEELWSAERCCAEIERHRVTVACFPPSYLHQLAEAVEQGGGAGRLASMRSYTVGGEALSRASFDLIARALKPPRLINGYGPTETVITPTIALRHVHPQGEGFDTGYMPIGRLVGARTAHVLDADLNLLPPGVPGELWLGGDGLARGYLNRPGLSAERFIADPFAGDGSRLYRSGDLVRWRADAPAATDAGELEYLGRLDHQVKIRGFRIELGEIEAGLLEQPGVRAAAVLAETEPRPRLLAYLAADADLDLAALRSALAARLPDYMVPAVIMRLSELPLNPNGKLDRARLPRPESRPAVVSNDGPQGARETALAAAWTEVLGLAQPPARSDNFFELGGDSILSLQIVSRLRRRGYALTPRQVFEHQSLAAQAATALPIEGERGMAEEAADDGSPFAPLPIQAQFLARQPAHALHRFNQAVLLRAATAIDAAALAAALAALRRHHAALRLRFARSADGAWTQAVVPETELAADGLLWRRVAADAAAITALCEEAQDSLDPRRGELLRGLLIDVAGDGQRLLVVAHHLAVDGMSWRVLLGDLRSAHAQVLCGESPALAPVGTSLRTWSRLLWQELRPLALAERPYWEEATSLASVDLPCDDAAAGEPVVETALLSAPMTAALLREAPAAFRIQTQDLLLTALGRALQAWTGRARTLVALEGHGREQLFDDLDLTRTVGWFTSLFPFALEAHGELGDALRRVKQALRCVPRRGLGAGLACPELGAPRLLFNYLGQFDADLDEAWRPAAESPGAEQHADSARPYEIVIDALVVEGRLRLHLGHDARRHAPASMKALLRSFETELSALIAYCLEPAQRQRGATPSDFPLVALEQDRLDDLPLAAEQREVLEDLWPTTPIQRGLLFHSVFDAAGGDGAYVNQLCVDLSGLDVMRLGAAWCDVLARHAVLRSAFIATDSESPLQWVAREAELPLRVIDARALDEAGREALADSELVRGFDLASPPLMRVLLLDLGAGRMRLIWTLHHLLLDGWSAARLLAEVLRLHNGETLTVPSASYRDYLGWIARADNGGDQSFWREELARLDAPTLLAAALPAPEAGVRGAATERHVELALAPALTAALRALARRERVTLNTVVQLAWALLLQRYTGQARIVFGATVAGRPADLPGADEMLGLFINTVPLVCAPPAGERLGEALRVLQQRNLTLREHERTPLYEIQRWAGQGALFDTLVVFENYPVEEALKQGASGGLCFDKLVARERTSYALTLSAALHGEALALALDLDPFRLDRPAVVSLGDRLQTLLEGMAQSNTETRLAALSLLDAGALARLAALGRGQALPAAASESLHARFERCARNQGGAPALLLGDAVLSYGELNLRANRLAHVLIARGVGPDTRVGIATERSFEMVIAVLAVLKAGGAYVPLDPAYPQERLALMMADGGLSLVIGDQDSTRRLPPMPGLAVMDAGETGADLAPAFDPERPWHPEALAYLIYTSGSTGRPKGVGLSQRCLAEHAEVSVGFFGLRPQDRVLQFSTLNFDGFVEQLFPALSIGAAVVLRGPELWDSATFRREVLERRISVADLTTAYWHLLAKDFARAPAADWGVLRQVHAGGEAMPPEALKAWRAGGFAHVRLLNTYGPTEATVTATVLDCEPFLAAIDAAALPTQMPIGAALPGRTLCVLDGDLNPVPLGVAGELCIGGPLLARGYHGRAGLSAERFIADPLVGGGARLYRTGDLVRWNLDASGGGELVYLGRIDHQVKIRGFRIELGEIEARLLALAGVREAVAIVRTDGGGPRLIAYASPQQGFELDAAALRASLAALLPDFMRPQSLIVVPALPLNPNGKIDRARLPVPVPGLDDALYDPPQGELEALLAEVWTEVLEPAVPLGRRSNFFELGGDSIRSLQIIGRLRARGWTATPRQLFEQQTIIELAAVLGRAPLALAVSALPSAPELASRGRLDEFLAPAQRAALAAELGARFDSVVDLFPLSPTQEGMLFHSVESPGQGLYVNQLSVTVEGIGGRAVDPQRLESAWRAMIARHEALRTGFLWRDGMARPLQLVFAEGQADFFADDWRGQTEIPARLEALAQKELCREYDWLQPPLARVRLLRLDEWRWQLVWTQHHILLDGWSDSRLVGEWLRCYAGEALEPVGPGFGTHVRWLAARDPGRTEAFWRGELAGIEGPTLLADAARADGDAAATGFAKHYSRFGAAETAALQAFAQRERVTANTVVQAAWALLLGHHLGRDKIVFGATVAGRPLDLPDADRIMGLFINTMAVPVERRAEMSVGAYLRTLQALNVRLRDHEHAALTDVQRWAGTAGRALFDSIVVFENFPVDRALRDTERYGLRFGAPANQGLTGYAMDLQVQLAETLVIEYCFARTAFSEAFLGALAAQMEHLLRQMMAAPGGAVGELRWIGDDEAVALAQLGRGNHELVAPSFVHERIAAQARSNPDAVAIELGDVVLSRGALDRRASALARDLVARGVQAGAVIGVAMERSLDSFIALLSVLKAGAAYLPLDIDYPAERIAFMVEDSGAQLVLTQAELLPRLALPLGVELLLLPQDQSCVGGAEFSVPVHPRSAAYVIYTSGSTGRPKGVVVEHGPLAMHCPATAALYEMGPNSCELLFMSLSFDGAHERWLTALGSGARVALRGQALWSADQTHAALWRHGVTHAAFPPAYLTQLAEWVLENGVEPAPVELYCFGGEAMPRASYGKVRAALRPRWLINGYGPTETVVTPLIWKAAADTGFEGIFAPIGRAVGARTLHVLDAELQPVPRGAVGELYIGGLGVARGYLARPGLSAERFVADPFSSDGGRLYRSGDLVRWREDAAMDYIGRVDDQVKVRGFRVELGEIEARLRAMPGLADVAVLALPLARGGHELVAFVVASEARAAERAIAALAAQLPAHMVPARISTLATLPRLISGKLDRAALAALETQVLVTGGGSERLHVPPSTPAARALAVIWQELLGVERVGETDSFFELGGDSLLSLKLLARIRAQRADFADFELKLRDLMQRPTIAGLLKLDGAEAAADTFVALNRSVADVAPLFCIHAGLGTVFDYGPLAEVMDGQRHLLGLPFGSADATDCATLADLARRHALAIRARQPSGAVHLLGWSVGGTLAALIAAEIECAGGTVGFIGLVDPWVPGEEVAPASDEASLLRLALADFISLVLPGAILGTEELGVYDESSLVALFARLRARAGAGAGAGAGARSTVYAQLNDAELAHLFAAAWRLVGLSRATVAESLALSQSVRAACWWAGEPAAASAPALERWLGVAPMQVEAIAAEHFEIIRDRRCIEAVDLELAESGRLQG